MPIMPFVLVILGHSPLVDTGQADAPEDVVVRDRILQLFALIWAAVFATGILIT